ncbi:MAG: hypothetical protein LBV39_03450, partial [Bacteroidales bacterium]|nr:hypothetical protein [Bacteroidales bacterium]
MRKIATFFFVAVIFFLCNSTLSAQNKLNKVYELHFGVAGSNVIGDIGSGFQLSQTRPVVYIGGRYDMNEYFSGKVNLFAGRTAGKASKTDIPTNCAFTAPIYEVSAQLEWNVVRLNGSLGSLIAGKRGITGVTLQTRPYLFAGVGFVFSKPVFSEPITANNLPDGAIAKEETAAGFSLPFGFGIR